MKADRPDEKREVSVSEFVRMVASSVGSQLMQMLADPSERELFRQANRELAHYGLRLVRVAPPLKNDFSEER